MKKNILLIFASLLAIFLAACNDDNDDAEVQEENNTEEAVQLEITDEEVVDVEEVVISVNGNEITGDKYNNTYRQWKTMLHMYGQDVSDVDALKEETLSILTERELIRQDAIDSGIEVTDEEAQEEMENLIEQNGEEAVVALQEQYGLSEEEFLEQLKDDLLTVKYIESKFEVDVTDEEVEERYEQLKEQHEDLGELEELEDVLRQNIMEEKQNELLNERLSELKEEADIETFI